MKLALRIFVVPLLLLAFSGFARKEDFIVRFYAETTQQDTERFASPVELKYPPRSTFVARVPFVSERDVKGVFPFSTPDGSWGCSFQLDPSGRLRLYTTSTENRGRSIVVFVGTKRGTHQVIDMIIDRPISDGIITIQRGLTIMEIKALQDHFPIVGHGKKVPVAEPAKPSKMPEM